MPWIDLRTGYPCNQRCRFCDQAGREGDAPTDVVIERIRGLSGDGLWLAGGEITLRPDLPRLLRAAREAGFRRIGVQTNGRILAAPGAAAALRREGLTDAIVAIHGPRELHDWVTQSPGAWRQATTGTRALVQAGVRTRLATVMTRSLARDLVPTAKLALALGVAGHRWIFPREEGPEDPRGLAPRYSNLALEPALRLEREAPIEVETVGVPLCRLPGMIELAADRLDAPATTRAFPAGLDEAPRARTYGPGCTACTLRGVCPGVEPAYTTRWGWDEFEGTPAPAQDPLLLPVPGPCPIGCAGCFVPAMAAETGRTLRQRLVRAAREGVTGVAFAGQSPWAHPELPKLIGEADRLGFARIEVWGPILPVDDAGRLAPLTRVRVPIGPWPDDALARLREVAPGCVIERYPPGRAAGALYRADGDAARWAACQPRDCHSPA